MKKAIAYGLVVLASVAFVACGDKDDAPVADAGVPVQTFPTPAPNGQLPANSCGAVSCGYNGNVVVSDPNAFQHTYGPNYYPGFVPQPTYYDWFAGILRTCGWNVLFGTDWGSWDRFWDGFQFGFGCGFGSFFKATSASDQQIISAAAANFPKYPFNAQFDGYNVVSGSMTIEGKPLEFSATGQSHTDGSYYYVDNKANVGSSVYLKPNG